MMRNIYQEVKFIQHISEIPLMLNVICRVTNMDCAVIARLTNERWIACSVLDNAKFGLIPGAEVDVEQTICNETRKLRSPVVIDNVVNSPFYHNHIAPQLYGFQSFISVPIIRKSGEFFGTLCVMDRHQKTLNTPEIIGMLGLFSKMITLHLDTVAMEKDFEITVSEEQKTAALRERFIAILGHDLRNPLNAIQAGIQIFKKSPEKAQFALPLIERCAHRMTELVRSILDFSQGRMGGGLSLEKVFVDELQTDLEQVADELRAIWVGREIRSVFDLHQPVRCDRARIAQLLSNLLTNALKYGAATEPVLLTARIVSDQLELVVSNKGTPIPPNAIVNLFQPFFRATPTSHTHGLGLGLFIVSEIARAHGGTIHATSTSEMTEFTLRMPCDG